jgi:hypothetical protein
MIHQLKNVICMKTLNSNGQNGMMLLNYKDSKYSNCSFDQFVRFFDTMIRAKAVENENSNMNVKLLSPSGVQGTNSDDSGYYFVRKTK